LVVIGAIAHSHPHTLSIYPRDCCLLGLSCAFAFLSGGYLRLFFFTPSYSFLYVRLFQRGTLFTVLLPANFYALFLLRKYEAYTMWRRDGSRQAGSSLAREDMNK
jgi:hypothetical protein